MEVTTNSFCFLAYL